MGIDQTVSFTKMSGAGNDFIMMERVPKRVSLKKFAQRVCDRTNGIGADGLILVEKSKKKNFDYKMRIINADGSEAEMCGNGARCFAAYVVKHFSPDNDIFFIETLSGEILGKAIGEKVMVRLTPPRDCETGLPLLLKGREIHVGYIDTGVPHAVIFVKDLENIDVNAIGREIRFHKTFAPRGTNVNFVESFGNDRAAVRTYERGVEAETKACGTGTVASAVLSYLALHPDVKKVQGAIMKMRTFGGETLSVSFDVEGKIISNVWLKGSARFICQGEFFL